MTYTIAVCAVKTFLMMDRETFRNMYSFIPKINLRNQCKWLVYIMRIYRDAISPERQINIKAYITILKFVAPMS